MTDEPSPNVLRGLNIAYDEDEARDWLNQWRASTREQRLHMETQLVLLALTRNSRDQKARAERQDFERLMKTIDPDAADIDPGQP
jgi:hypothetical protein